MSFWARDPRPLKPYRWELGGCETMRPPNGGLRPCWAQPKLPRHSFAAVPVAAALVFTEDEFLVRTPMPIIFMNDDTRFVGKVIRFMGMPAGIALAYDGCGCAESGGHDHHRGDCGCGKQFSEHTFLHRPFARRANTFAGLRFRGETKIVATFGPDDERRGRHTGFDRTW
jgi:hypothetical protein